MNLIGKNSFSTSHVKHYILVTSRAHEAQQRYFLFSCYISIICSPERDGMYVSYNLNTQGILTFDSIPKILKVIRDAIESKKKMKVESPRAMCKTLQRKLIDSL